MIFRLPFLDRGARGLSGVDVEYDDTPIWNPCDLAQGTSYRRRGEGLFRMWAAVEYSKQYNVYIWADGFESAWEELVEYLDAHAPGVFEKIGEDELKEAASDLGLTWQTHWPDWSDPDFEKVVEQAEMDMTVIGHTTLKSGGTHIRSDLWGGNEVTDDDELNEVWTLSAESCEDDEEYEAPDGVTRTRPSKFRVRKGARIIPTLDGAQSGRTASNMSGYWKNPRVRSVPGNYGGGVGNPENEEGLTLQEWLDAATGLDHDDQYRWQLQNPDKWRDMMNAWQNGEDPTDWRAALSKGSRRARKGAKIKPTLEALPVKYATGKIPPWQDAGTWQLMEYSIVVGKAGIWGAGGFWPVEIVQTKPWGVVHAAQYNQLTACRAAVAALIDVFGDGSPEHREFVDHYPCDGAPKAAEKTSRKGAKIKPALDGVRRRR